MAPTATPQTIGLPLYSFSILARSHAHLLASILARAALVLSDLAGRDTSVRLPTTARLVPAALIAALHLPNVAEGQRCGLPAADRRPPPARAACPANAAQRNRCVDDQTPAAVPTGHAARLTAAGIRVFEVPTLAPAAAAAEASGCGSTPHTLKQLRAAASTAEAHALPLTSADVVPVAVQGRQLLEARGLHHIDPVGDLQLRAPDAAERRAARPAGRGRAAGGWTGSVHAPARSHNLHTPY